MKIVEVPARTGLLWAREGARLFAARPLALTSLVGIYLLMIIVPTLVPLVGPALGGVMLPFATLALMLACREVAAGRVPTARVFAAPFQDPPRRLQLFRLGLLYAGLSLLFAVLFAMLDLDVVQPTASPPATPPSTSTPGADPTAAPAPSPATSPSPATGDDASALLLRFDLLVLQLLLLTPLFMAMWFAPVFVGWHLMSPVKAMFFSFFACWRNKWAILVFGAAALGVAALGSAMLAFVVGLFGPGTVTANLVLAPWALCLTAYLYAAMYPMYRSVVDDPMQG